MDKGHKLLADNIAGLIDEADEYFGKANFVKAEKAALEALSQIELAPPELKVDKLASEVNQALVNMLLGFCCFHTSRFKESITYFQSILEDKSERSLSLKSKALYGIANAQRELGEMQTALRTSEASLALAVSAGDKEREGAALSHIASTYRFLNEHSKAFEYYDRAFAIASEIDNSRLGSSILNNTGQLHMILGNYSSALDYYSRSVAIAEEIGDSANLMHTYHNLGIVYQFVGDVPRAHAFSKRALALAEENGNKAHASAILSSIGGYHKHLGDYSRALDCDIRSLALAEEVGDEYHVGVALCAIGVLHLELRDFVRALDYFHRALTLTEKIGDYLTASTVMVNIGVSHENLDDLSSAIVYFMRAQELSKRIGDLRGATYAMEGIAEVERKRGNLMATYQALSEVLRIRHDELKSNEGIPATLHKLGMVYLEKEETQEGLDRLQDALRLAKELGDAKFTSAIHYDLAEAYAKKNDMANAYLHLKGNITLTKEMNSDEFKQRIEAFNMRVEIEEMEHGVEMQRLHVNQLEKDLSSSTLQLLSQTELLSDLRKDLLQIARKIPPTEPAAKELRERVKNLPCQSIDWDKFDVQFKAAHPEFVKKLIERFPDLTPMETRVCTLLRLNLKSIEIAKMFCLEERSVETHRFNIRKKLKIETKQSLSNFLNTL